MIIRFFHFYIEDHSPNIFWKQCILYLSKTFIFNWRLYLDYSSFHEFFWNIFYFRSKKRSKLIYKWQSWWKNFFCSFSVLFFKKSYSLIETFFSCCLTPDITEYKNNINFFTFKNIFFCGKLESVIFYFPNAKQTINQKLWYKYILY